MAIIPSDRKNTNHSPHTKIKIHRPPSKQFIGLNHCQAHDLQNLDFDFNASLASVNIAKVECIRYYSNLSIGLLKHFMCNIHMLKRILAQIGIRPNRTLNAKFVKELFGLVADVAQPIAVVSCVKHISIIKNMTTITIAPFFIVSC